MLSIVVLLLWSSTATGPTPVAVQMFSTGAACEQAKVEWIKDKVARKIIGAVCLPASIPAAP